LQIKNSKWEEIERVYRENTKSKDLRDIAQLTPAILEGIVEAAGEDPSQIDNIFYK